MIRLDRHAYASIYGPTTGDTIRLGDTVLFARVDHDHTVYGDECKFGGGKVLRDRMGQAVGVAAADALDLVITNAVVIDWTGVYKADLGIKAGRIAGIGKAGNPAVMAGVTPGTWTRRLRASTPARSAAAARSPASVATSSAATSCSPCQCTWAPDGA